MAKHWMGLVSMVVIGSSLLPACSDTPVDIGEKNPQLAKSDLAAYAASWDGYAEAYQFEDGEDRVRLVLDEQGNGTIRFGERDLIGPATAPTGYYPPQVSTDPFNTAKFWSGFPYSVRNTQVQSERIQFGVSKGDLFASYCALQSVYPRPISYLPSSRSLDDLRYACSPYAPDTTIFDASGGCRVPTGTTEVAVDCQQAAMCVIWDIPDIIHCVCNESSCSVGASPDAAFDAALDNAQETLVGTIVIDAQRITVRLTRQ